MDGLTLCAPLQTALLDSTATLASLTCACQQEMNRAGAAKMQRHLTLLRDALGRLGGQRPDDSSARAHERARAYYGLLALSTDALLAHLEQARQHHFTSAEMGALLQVGAPLLVMSHHLASCMGCLWCNLQCMGPQSSAFQRAASPVAACVICQPHMVHKRLRHQVGAG